MEPKLLASGNNLHLKQLFVAVFQKVFKTTKITYQNQRSSFSFLVSKFFGFSDSVQKKYFPTTFDFISEI